MNGKKSFTNVRIVLPLEREGNRTKKGMTRASALSVMFLVLKSSLKQIGQNVKMNKVGRCIH